MKKNQLNNASIVSILCLFMAWMTIGNVWGQTSNPDDKWDVWDGASTDTDWITEQTNEGKGGSEAEPYEITTAAQLLPGEVTKASSSNLFRILI